VALCANTDGPNRVVIRKPWLSASHFVLTCSADGFPSPVYQWNIAGRRDDVLQRGPNFTLDVCKFVSNASVVVECAATVNANRKNVNEWAILELNLTAVHAECRGKTTTHNGTIE